MNKLITLVSNTNQTSVKGNSETEYRKGKVNITAENIGASEKNHNHDNTYAKKSIYSDSSINLGRKSGSTVGNYSFAVGSDTTASGAYSHVEGYHTTSSASNSHAEGGYTTASGAYSHVEGYYTTSSNFASHTSGKYNKDMTNGASANKQVGDVFVIGNGTGITSRSNAFRVTYAGDVLTTKAYTSSGADYAELIKPWFDDNEENEDRVGYFVTIKDGKLYKANEGDYIVGITSGNPSVIGNGDEDYYWRYDRDKFNRILMEDVPEIVQKVDENNNPMYDENHEPIYEETGNIIPNARMKLNPNYDSSKQNDYIPRSERKEWDYVGMLGVLPVRDDGTCIPGSFCKCKENGIATAATGEEKYSYFVIERIDEETVSIILK